MIMNIIKAQESEDCTQDEQYYNDSNKGGRFQSTLTVAGGE